jgi:hypothetical protein
MTTPLTTTVIALPAGFHTWKVNAFNQAGISPASEERKVQVLNQIFFPLISQMCQPAATVQPLAVPICTQSLYSPFQGKIK